VSEKGEGEGVRFELELELMEMREKGDGAGRGWTEVPEKSREQRGPLIMKVGETF
jgi:hypothetical protein